MNLSQWESKALDLSNLGPRELFPAVYLNLSAGSSRGQPIAAQRTLGDMKPRLESACVHLPLGLREFTQQLPTLGLFTEEQTNWARRRGGYCKLFLASR